MDTNKIEKGLECCTDPGFESCKLCPYEGKDCALNLLKDAYEVIKSTSRAMKEMDKLIAELKARNALLYRSRMET